MIPLRLELAGWLTYREAVTLDFTQHWLWAITGENGAGKSALFDAITYALYGEHRGGAQHDERLVSQGQDLARVVFDFAVNDQPYRIERTLTVRQRRSRAQRGAASSVDVDKAVIAYRLDSGGEGLEPVPLPIPGTETIRGLQEWVRRIVGLGFDTFVASVLLRQGEADRLVTALPSDRKRILLNLLDLQPYEQLEATARKRQQRHLTELGIVNQELAGLTDATAAALVEAEAEAARLQEAASVAQAAVEAATLLRQQADLFAKRSAELAAAIAVLRADEAVLAEAGTIEREYAELTRLTEALPALTALLGHQDRAAAATAEATALLKRAEAIDLVALQAAHDTASGHREEAETALVAAREAVRACDSAREALRPHAMAGRKLTELEQTSADTKADLIVLHGKLADRQVADDHLEACDAAWQALQPLQTIRLQRRNAALAAQHLQAAEVRLLVLRAEVDDLVGQRDEARIAAQDADALAEARRVAFAVAAGNRQRQAADLDTRRGATSEAVCQRCGQPIDPARLAEEIVATEQALVALDREIADLTRRAQEAEAEQGQRDAAATALAERVKGAQDTLARLELDHQHQAERRGDAQQAAEAARAILPPPYAALAIAEGYPTADQVAVADALARQRDQARQVCREYDDRAARVCVLDEQQAARQRQLHALTEGQDRDVLLAAVARDRELEVSRPGLVVAELRDQATSQATQVALVTAQRQLGEQKAERERLLAERAGQQQRVHAEGAAMAALRHHLGPTWDADLDILDSARLAACRERVEALDPATGRKADLDRRRSEHRANQERATWLRGEIAAIPEAARLPVPEAIARLIAATEARDVSRDAATEQARAVAVLTERSQRRDALVRRQDAAVRQRDDYARLTQLLGKQGLQSWLVQGAQEQIGLAANEFLAQLSGGALQLEFEARGEELEMLVSDFDSGRAPLDVRFISGSQRFRVAVALALAVGQYAGDGARAIRAVIIDEGFGSLDSDGRRDMIALLQGLGGVLDRVLLVSHQEEFQDAFPHGYQIEKTPTGSRAHRRVPTSDVLDVGL